MSTDGAKSGRLRVERFLCCACERAAYALLPTTQALCNAFEYVSSDACPPPGRLDVRSAFRFSAFHVSFVALNPLNNTVLPSSSISLFEQFVRSSFLSSCASASDASLVLRLTGRVLESHVRCPQLHILSTLVPVICSGDLSH